MFSSSIISRDDNFLFEFCYNDSLCAMFILDWKAVGGIVEGLDRIEQNFLAKADYFVRGQEVSKNTVLWNFLSTVPVSLYRRLKFSWTTNSNSIKTPLRFSRYVFLASILGIMKYFLIFVVTTVFKLCPIFYFGLKSSFRRSYFLKVSKYYFLLWSKIYIIKLFGV